MLTATPPDGLSFNRLLTPTGEAILMWDAAERLRVLDWVGYEPRMMRMLHGHYGPIEPKLAAPPARLKAALTAYFDGELNSIDAIACATGGTVFQRAVWAALRAIPAGTTLSYGALALRLGNPKAVRAVGRANGCNPIGLVVPCHRVIGTDGSLTGYGGGIERKRWLLVHEKAAGGVQQILEDSFAF